MNEKLHHFAGLEKLIEVETGGLETLVTNS